MSPTQTAPAQQQQLQPGQGFRVPLVGAPPRFVYEDGPCAPATSVTLNQTSQVKASLGHFENLDIVRSYFCELDWSITYTEGGSQTLTQSPLFPFNLIQSESVSMQAAYKTMNMPGWMAQVMQEYRSQEAPKSFTIDNQNGANNSVGTGGVNGSQAYSNALTLATPNLSPNLTGTANTFKTFIEIPVATYFDLYWEIDPQSGTAVIGYPRAIVSPARMAATQRNVTPTLIFNPLIDSQDLYDAGVSKASADSTSTATGTVALTWWRNGWVPTDNPVTEPPNYAWQYARQELSIQPSGAKSPPINLADDRAGQGQILSLIFFTWDPALNSGAGGITPPANYSELQLVKGSTVQLFDDSPYSNVYRWSNKHGRALPYGMFGWDLALTDDGKLTNENALNTLVEAGCQIIPTYSTQPSSTSTIYVGVESLQAVTN